MHPATVIVIDDDDSDELDTDLYEHGDPVARTPLVRDIAFVGLESLGITVEEPPC